jgi:diguanylate cyclase (GGDEF)-like protein
MERRERPDDRPSILDVTADLTEMSMRGLAPTVLVGIVGLAGATAVLAHRYRDSRLGGLAVVMVLLGLARVAVVFKLERNAAFRNLFLARKTRRRLFELLLLLYFGTLAASTLWNFHLRRAPAEMLCSLGIFLFCIGINGRIQWNPSVSKLQGLLLLFVLAVCLWNPRDDVAITAEVLLALFAFAHCRAVQEKYDIVVEQLRDHRELRRLSEVDPLTGLVNRRGFELALDDLCRQGSLFALLAIDLDRFKPVNDLHGHAVGDELLRQVGQRLASIVRAHDIVARLGGDEFMVLQLPVTERRSAQALAERVTHALARPFDAGGIPINIGASVGIAMPSAGEADPVLLLKRADDALYTAKQAGRGRWVYAEPEGVLVTHRSM